MTSISETEKKWRAIEEEHFGRCIWQAFAGDRIMIELLEHPKANSTALVVKHFDGKVRGSRKWPAMTACYVYLPVDDSNTWDGLEKHLAEHEQRRLTKTPA